MQARCPAVQRGLDHRLRGARTPGGMDVREATMLLLFTPVIGAGATLGISVTMRVTSVLGDRLAFLLGGVSLKMLLSPVQNYR